MEIEFGKITGFFRPTIYYIRMGDGPLNLYDSEVRFMRVVEGLSRVYKEVDLSDLYVFVTRRSKKYIINVTLEEK